MPELFTVRVPDIGDFEDVEVVELLVSPGDTLAVDDPILVLESDKASMEVPAPVAGRVERLLVRVGDQVSEGAPICSIEPAGDAPPAGAPDTPPEPSAPAGRAPWSTPGSSRGRARC